MVQTPQCRGGGRLIEDWKVDKQTLTAPCRVCKAEQRVNFDESQQEYRILEHSHPSRNMGGVRASQKRR
jgi:hypothetical protein